MYRAIDPYVFPVMKVAGQLNSGLRYFLDFGCGCAV
jgi:hypothetical protein